MRNKKGFTLIELLAVVGVLAVLMLIAIPAVLQYFKEARKDAFLTDIRTMLTESENEYVMQQANQKFINVLASQANYVTIANENLKPGDAPKVSGSFDYDGKRIDYYIELDSNGIPNKYVFTNGELSIYSISGVQEVSTGEIIEEGIDMEAYIREFNIKGPFISTNDTYAREALDFNFVAKELIGAGPNGTNLNTWTSQDGSVQGTIYQYSSSGPKITPIANPTFVNRALVLNGEQALRFNANFNYSGTGAYDDLSDEYGSFTLEATVNFDKFHAEQAGYTNIISNVENGGYYLNVYTQKLTPVYKGQPGIGIYMGGNYRQCTLDQFINTGENHVIAASFNKSTGIAKVYLDGNLEKTCNLKSYGTFTYPKVYVPLSVGGNPGPDGSYFTDREWLYGKLYTARIYKGVMNDTEIYKNYLSNYLLVNNLSEESQTIDLTNINENVPVQKIQYSLDGGNTWIDYDATKPPVVTEDTLVYARSISRLGVISPVSKAQIYID